MSERRDQIHAEHELPKKRRCELLDVARSTAYYRPEPVSEEDLALMTRFTCNGRSTEAGGCATNWRIAATRSTASGPSV
jgi:hypothetical protein